MARSIKARLGSLTAQKAKIVDRIYGCGAPADRFFTCLEKAPEDLRRRYEELRSACIELEGEAVAAGKAYRNSLGSLTFYR